MKTTPTTPKSPPVCVRTRVSAARWPIKTLSHVYLGVVGVVGVVNVLVQSLGEILGVDIGVVFDPLGVVSQ
jgi:hypothetical protein